MKAVGVIQANLKQSFIATASRLAEDLYGQAVLTRTLQRVSASELLDCTVVVCPPDQFDEVSRLADLPKVIIKKLHGPAYPMQNTIRVARKWALESWRGGMANTCFFDEHTDPVLGLAIAEQLQPDLIVSIAAEGPLVAPSMIDKMINHYIEANEEVHLVFAQTPPGLSPAIFPPATFKEISQVGLAPGWINAYRPDQARRDMINDPTCFRPALNVLQAGGRLTSDTQRGFRRLKHIVDQLGPEPTADQTCQCLTDMQTTSAEPFPCEIQIELTTEDQHLHTKMRPRGAIVGQRGPLSTQLFQKIISECIQWDDVRIVLGGFGDPLLHPHIVEMLRICKQAGVFGLAIRSNGIAMNDEISKAMIDSDVNVIQILLDSATPELYRELHSCDAFGTVTQNIEQFLAIRESQQLSSPFVPASLVKSRETFDELDSFYDCWIRKTACAVIEGYSHHAKLLPDRCVMNMSPPKRIPCRQLRQRLTILANGNVTSCDQDFQEKYVLGNLADESLTDIWTGERLQALRAAQQSCNYGFHPMCNKCEEWHRP